jgi:RNA polymerase sigma-70 factor (ECF subfamily)
LILEKTIEELKNGNEKAFDAIIEQYQVNVYNTCLGFVQNEKDAEELTQDVFIKLYQKIGSFKGESAFSTWLYRISVNTCLVFEREKKAKKRFAIFGNLFHGSSKEPEPAEFNHPGVVLEKKENAKILMDAIRKLPESQKTAVLLKNMEGLSQQEIAAVMNSSIGAVESLLQRAKQNLKKEIEKNLS